MIGYIEGEPLYTSKEKMILKTPGGIGYEIYCSKNTLFQIQDQSFVKLWIHTYIKEDKMDLFGFQSLEEKTWFLSLIKVNGIGPKIALQILSSKSLSELSYMIEEGDIKGLSHLPKVGKKMAEQMILALKGQLKGILKDSEKKAFPAHEQITSALYNLGFKRDEVNKVLSTMDRGLEVQEGIRKALIDLQSMRNV